MCIIGMARKLAGVTRDNKVYETLESRFGMFLASNTQGARFIVQCVGPTETSQMELAAEHDLHDQSVEALMDDSKASDVVRSAEEASEDKAQLRQSLELDPGEVIRDVNHEQHEHSHPNKAVGKAVDIFMRAKDHSDAENSSKTSSENDSSQPKPPPLPSRPSEKAEPSLSDRWAKGVVIMKGTYQKYKPMVMAHVTNNSSSSSVNNLSAPSTNNFQSRPGSRSTSSLSDYPGDQSSPSFTPSPSPGPTKSESRDSIKTQSNTYYSNLGHGNVPTVDISSQPGGHFNGTLRVTNEDIQAYKETNNIIGGHPRSLKLHAYHPEMADESVGIVNLIDPKGISVISDIDDTIKETNVLAGAKTILQNTFLKDMQAVSGMAEVYMKWWENGAAFHYVSNSPWQLIPTLLDFFRSNKFPPGSAHLRLHDSVLKTYFMTPGEHKFKSIREILKDFPDRKFILIGDSGEIDMEIYTQLAVEYPEQVFRVFIRDITTARLQEMVEKSYSAPTRSRSFTSAIPKTSMFSAAAGFISRQIDCATAKVQSPSGTESSNSSTRAGYPFPAQRGDTETGTTNKQEDTDSFTSVIVEEFDQGTEQQESQTKPALNHKKSDTFPSGGSTPGKAPPLPPREPSQQSPNRVSASVFSTTTSFSSSPTSISASVSTTATRVSYTTDVAALDDEPMPGAPPPSEPLPVKNPLEIWQDRIRQCQKMLPEGTLTLFQDSSKLLECPLVSEVLRGYSGLPSSNGVNSDEKKESEKCEDSLATNVPVGNLIDLKI
ncbi:hypothetical protein BGZ46_002977 [Entomortierella lignicola]|nr:hypothetical protein BGZ46_002977 [Entomortierella lignicola]